MESLRGHLLGEVQHMGLPRYSLRLLQFIDAVTLRAAILAGQAGEFEGELKAGAASRRSVVEVSLDEWDEGKE